MEEQHPKPETDNIITQPTVVEPLEKRTKLEDPTETENKAQESLASPKPLNARQQRRIEKAAKRAANKEKILPEHCNDMMPKRITYYVKNGIRFLDPYWSIYGAYAKGRWVGREVHEVFQTEFLSHNPLYPKAAIRHGRVFINGKPMLNPHYRFRSSDRIVHLGHRHEHPILADPPISVIADTDRFFVVDKPPSMPVHACGRYKVHSVIGLLNAVHRITNLRVCHRLDRTTSGVLIFAKDHATDIMVKDEIQSRQLHKEYICKVDGIFPEEEQTCEAPIGVLSVIMGIQYVTNEGRPCRSHFRRLSVNHTDNTSLVSCKIETGRTHQIRVHLQYLGYPIVADYFYNDDVWGPKRGRGANYGQTVEELKAAVHKRHKSSVWIEEEDPKYEENLRKIAENELHEPELIDINELRLDEMPTYDPLCLGCNVRKRVPDMRHLRMMLHCWRYRGASWQFEAPLPDWAAELRGDSDAERLTHPLLIPSTVKIGHQNDFSRPDKLFQMPILEERQVDT